MFNIKLNCKVSISGRKGFKYSINLSKTAEDVKKTEEENHENYKCNNQTKGNCYRTGFAYRRKKLCFINSHTKLPADSLNWRNENVL